MHIVDLNQIRLAALQGHTQLNSVVTRRVLLAELLAESGPHQRAKIFQTLEKKLGRCWGKRPDKTLQRDLKALRSGGLRIGYSRRKGVEGYFLKYPALESQMPKWKEPKNEHYWEAVRKMSVPEKNERAFEMASFALNQRRLILQQENPDWPASKVDEKAREAVYGISLNEVKSLCCQEKHS